MGCFDEEPEHQPTKEEWEAAMAHLHADGSEEVRPRSPEEIAAIEHEVRIAAQANLRQGERRQCSYFLEGTNRDQRAGDRRRILSTFERDMLLGNAPEGCAYTVCGKLIRYKKASHEDA